MASLFELAVQGPVVVDLSVHHELDGVVLQLHRLRTADWIDDRESRHPEVQGTAVGRPAVVGPPMLEPVKHSVERHDRVEVVELVEPSDPAHVRAPPADR